MSMTPSATGRLGSTVGRSLGLRSRVTVRADERSADVVVPTADPVADWMPSLLRAVVASDVTSPGGWRLTRATGETIEPELSLGDCGVLDGETLYLDPREALSPSIVIEDIVEEIISAPTRALDAATRRVTMLPLACVAATAGLVAAVVLGRDQPTLTGWCLGIVAVALLAVLWWVDRRLDDGPAAAAFGVVAAAYGGAAGGILTLGAGGGPLAVTTRSCAVALLVLLPMIACGSWPRAATAATAWVLVPLQLACLAVAWSGLGVGVAAAVSTVTIALALPMIPRGASWLSGLTRLPGQGGGRRVAGADRHEEQGRSVADRVAHARRVVAATVISSCVALPVLWGMTLVGLPSPWDWLLVAVSAVAVATRTRGHQHARDICILLSCGATGLSMALAAAVLPALTSGSAVGPVALAVVPLLVAAVGFSLAALDVPLDIPDVGARKTVRSLDLIARVAMIPMLLGAIGVLAWAWSVGRYFGLR